MLVFGCVFTCTETASVKCQQRLVVMRNKPEPVRMVGKGTGRWCGGAADTQPQGSTGRGLDLVSHAHIGRLQRASGVLHSNFLVEKQYQPRQQQPHTQQCNRSRRQCPGQQPCGMLKCEKKQRNAHNTKNILTVCSWAAAAAAAHPRRPAWHPVHCS